MRSGWTTETLGDLLSNSGGSVKTGPFGTVLKAAEYSDQGVPVISVGEIGDGEIRVKPGTPLVGPSTVERLPEYLLETGDIVFARKGSIDRTARVGASEDGYFLGSDGIRLRLPASVDSRFMAYQMRSPDVKAWLRQHAGGTTMPSLNQSILQRIPIRVPDVEEQRRIAGVLGALDDLIDTNRSLIALVRQVSQVKYESVVRDPVVAPLGDVARVNQGQTRKQSSGRLTYLDISSVEDGAANFDTRLDWEHAPSRARRLTKHGDTVWSMVRPNRRAHALVLEPPADLVVSTGLAVLSPTGVGPATLFAAVDRQQFVDYLVNNAHGSAYPAVNASTFETAPVALPGARQQHEFERSLWPLWEWAASLAKENEQLHAARNGLLPLLLSGRVSAGEVAA